LAHTYRLLRKGQLVHVFIDEIPSTTTLSANLRNELRGYLASFGLPQSVIDFKVHELYTTDSTTFSADSPIELAPVKTTGRST
jgi:hypothetical protein